MESTKICICTLDGIRLMEWAQWNTLDGNNGMHLMKCTWWNGLDGNDGIRTKKPTEKSA